jgi:hypothetical protein
VTGASRGRRYLRFLGLAVLVVVALLGIGFLPTRRLAGDEALPAMLVGCLIGLTSAGVAAWLRVAAALGGTLARMPLLFWLATSYVALLPLEVRLAIR